MAGAADDRLADDRAIAGFLAMLAGERGAAANTLAAYGRDLQQASAALGGRLAVADVADLQRLVSGWQGLARATVARRRSALRRFFRFLISDGVRTDNPASQLGAARVLPPVPRTLSVAEVDRLFALLASAADPPSAAARARRIRLRALLELLYGSGLRASELVALPRNAIRPPQPFAIVRGKGDKERLVPISRAALAAVAAQRAQVPADSRWLFPSRGGHLSRIRLFQLVKELAAAAGIAPARVSPHILRHAFATHMLANGADLRTLQTLLGHADISTTERYTHVDSGKLTETVTTLHPLATDREPAAALPPEPDIAPHDGN